MAAAAAGLSGLQKYASAHRNRDTKSINPAARSPHAKRPVSDQEVKLLFITRRASCFSGTYHCAYPAKALSPPVSANG
jgi:hypothetical protein